MKRCAATTAIAGLLVLAACGEQTPQDAATANMGPGKPGDTPPGELPPELSTTPAESGGMPGYERSADQPPMTDDVPPNAGRAPPEIVPDEALERPPR